MARVVKAPMVRRAELLDCAQALFFSAGYEATTIADIIARAGVSKGGFYHHFDSKEALLEALILRFIEQVLADSQDVLAAREMDALARLNAFFARARDWKIGVAPHLRPVFDDAFKPESEALFERLMGALKRIMAPVLTELIEDGARDGVFQTPDAGLAAEMMLSIMTSRRLLISDVFRDMDAGDLDLAAARIEARVAAEEKMVDRILGLAPGAVRFVEPGYIRSVLKMMIEGAPPLPARGGN